ncbi:MAG: hypothetical protein AB7N29_12865 [Vicinamibacterales bacterium]
MRRMFLLAIGLSALLWTAAARTAAVDVASGFSRTSASAVVDVASGFSRTSEETCALSSGTDSPSQSELKWLAQLHTIGIVTESIWKSSLVHVELGATRSPRSVDISLAATSPDPPAASAPPYLRHTPLLI